MWQTNEQIPDLYRTALKSSLDIMNICLCGIERMQEYQTGVVSDMRSRQGEISKQIGALRSYQELQAAHAELLRIQMVNMVSYWNGMCAANCQYQSEVLNDALVKASSAAQEIGLNKETSRAVALPVLTALKLVVGAAHSTYNATARATEEFARLGADQFHSSTPVVTHAEHMDKTKRAA